jgi:hypothetical protein
VFLHVPVGVSEDAIKTGVDVTIELIHAMVRSKTLAKLKAQPAAVGVPT